MAAPKGHKRYGGRKVGSVNRATADVRAAVAMLAEGNITKVQGWLDRGATSDPLGAARVFSQLLEYHVPKLSRAEVTGAGGAPFEVRIVDPTRHKS